MDESNWNKESVDLIYHADVETLYNEERAAGTYSFEFGPNELPYWLIVKLPGAGWIRIAVNVPGHHHPAGYPSWDMSERTPLTLSPSIRTQGGSPETCWHGWARQGRLVSC